MAKSKFRKIGLNVNRNPDFSVTRVKSGFHLFREADGMDIGVFSKETLVKRAGFSEGQLTGLKGTTNFVRVGKRQKRYNVYANGNLMYRDKDIVVARRIAKRLYDASIKEV